MLVSPYNKLCLESVKPAMFVILIHIVGVCDILNIVYPEDLVIQRDNVLIQSSRVVNLVMKLIKIYPQREGGSSYRSIH